MQISEKLRLENPGLEVDKIGDFFENVRSKIGFKEAILGFSGGIDSSLCAVIARRFMPRERLRVFFLPEKATPDRDREDVRKLADKYDFEVKTISIDQLADSYREVIGKLSRLSRANLKARIRMTILYAIANERDGIVLGTANLSEWLLGYFTKFGDGAADVEPLIHLYKSQVKQLAKHLNLPESIVTKPPSAGLWEGQTDEEELGARYELIDEILYCRESLGLSARQAKRKLEVDPGTVDSVYRMVETSAHKRDNPSGLADGF